MSKKQKPLEGLLGNRQKARIIARHIENPRGFLAKLFLWAGKKKPPIDHALLFHSAGVHTLGMRFAVDVVFLNEKMKVLKLVCGLRPFRSLGPVGDTQWILMLPGGALSPEVLEEGNDLEWIPRTSDRIAQGAVPPELL